MIFAISNDFSDEEFAAIGRLLWAFTVLENELARGAMKLREDVAWRGNSGPIDDQIRKIVKQDIKGRFDGFIAALKASSSNGEESDWIAEAETKFKDGLLWRNRICHGKWSRLGDGRMGVQFFDRDSVRVEQFTEIEPVSINDLGKLKDTTLLWVVEIARKAHLVQE